MKTSPALFLSFLLATLCLRSHAEPPTPNPGPEAGGLRLSLVITPRPAGGNEGYDVQLALTNSSSENIKLQATQWRARRHEGGFEDYLEAAASVESYPAIEPWLGQTLASVTNSPPEPGYELKPAETLSRRWHASGRRLKNRVSNPLEVQNPEFTESGLHSIHVTLVVMAGGRAVRLRSNEQLVPFGGSNKMPRHTYGHLWWTAEKTRTASLNLGSMHGALAGDRFLIQSENIGMTWTLTLTKIEPDHSLGTLEPSRANPMPPFPSHGAPAALQRTASPQ